MTNLQRTNEYWQKRIYKLESELTASVKVDELYNEAYDKLLKDVTELYKCVKSGEKFTRTDLYHYSKFLAFKNRLESESKRIGNTLHTEIENALTKAYKAAGLAAKERMGEKSVWTVQNRRMAKACIERDWAGSNFSKRIWKNRQAMAAAVREGVIDCVINGRTRADFINVLVKQFGDGDNPGAARSRAVTLTRTEVMHTLNTGAIETYASEGVHFLEWDAEPDACGECLELASHNGGIYPINEYPGAIAHPRCRCVPIPIEDDDPRVAGRLGKGDGTAKYRGKYPQSTGENVLDISGESGIIENEQSGEIEQTLRMTHSMQFAVPKGLTESRSFRSKFNNIVEGDEMLNREFYQKAAEMLHHRSGTNGEDLYLYNTRTRRWYSSTEGTKAGSPDYTNEIESALKNSQPGELIAFHNHPEGMPPSDSDFNAALRNGYAKGYTIGHNGRIFMYTAPNRRIDRSVYNSRVCRYKNDYGYTEYGAQIQALNDLKVLYKFNFIEVT